MPSFRLHKVLTFLLALALLAGIAPRSVIAAPADTSSSMMMMDGMLMHCDESMPAQDHQMPCDDGATCLGMLGCATAAVASAASVMPADFRVLESSWPPQAALDGLVDRPALPPPIA